MSTPPDPSSSSSATPPADPEASRIKSYDDRFKSLEDEQRKQGTVLEQILSKVGAAPSGSGPVNPASSEQVPADIGEQMRQAIRDVGAEDRERSQREQHDLEHQRMRDRGEHPEHRPRERRTPLRARLQKHVFGIDDSPGAGGRPGQR